jgi:DNA processing protein
VLQRMERSEGGRRSSRYTPPVKVDSIRLRDLLSFCDRPVDSESDGLFKGQSDADLDIFYAGNLALLKSKCVSVIGARGVSDLGAARARKVAKGLAEAGVIVTSGLAKGVDVQSHQAVLHNSGNTIAVIGTPLTKCYPIEHAKIQEEIYEHHLLISQFKDGTRTFPSDFPKRNRLMAALTDASVIVEASDSSGTLHQAAECVRLGRWLFIMRSVVENRDLAWPRKFLKEPKVKVLSEVEDILEAIG